MITRTSDINSSYLPIDIPKSYQYISTFLNNYKLETALPKPNRIKTSDYNLNLTKNKSIVKKNKLYLNKEAQLFSCVTTTLPKISYVSDFKKRLISKAINYTRFITILLVLFASYLPAQNEAYYIESLNEILALNRRSVLFSFR